MRQSDTVLERLYRFHPKIIDLSLDRMHRILAALDNPHEKLPPVIHVAGTNGKGSTIAYLRSILEAAGLKVHVYTSPHLVRFAERIRLAGNLISEDQLMQTLLACEEANGETPITYFEITTAAAMKAFAESPADVVLLEVGLGGRLDATNVIDQPLSTVITPVSMDHQQFLGNDVATIAAEKAGIAKQDVPLVIGKQSDDAMTSILDKAQKANAEIISGWQTQKTDNGFTYQDQQGTIALPAPNLYGPHQIDNAGLAIATLRHQNKFHITEDQIREGITSAEWPARLQNITDSEYGHLLPKGSELWLDGGHNPAAGETIAGFLSEQDDKPLYMICGMMTNKDTTGFLAPLAAKTIKLFGIHVDGEDSHSAEDICAMAQQVDIKSAPVTHTEEALKAIPHDNPVRVMICGSLYLAGQILGDNDLLPQ